MYGFKKERSFDHVIHIPEFDHISHNLEGDHDDLYLEEEDTKHINDGGGHCSKVSLILLVDVCLIH